MEDVYHLVRRSGDPKDSKLYYVCFGSKESLHQGLKEYLEEAYGRGNVQRNGDQYYAGNTLVAEIRPGDGLNS